MPLGKSILVFGVRILVLVFLGGKSSGSVHNLNSKLVGSLDDLLALLGVEVVSNDGSEFLVVHQEHLKIRRGLDDEGVKSVLELMAGLLSGTITDLGHQDGTLELSSNSVINTTGLSPARLRKGTNIANNHILGSHTLTLSKRSDWNLKKVLVRFLTIFGAFLGALTALTAVEADIVIQF